MFFFLSLVNKPFHKQTHKDPQRSQDPGEKADSDFRDLPQLALYEMFKLKDMELFCVHCEMLLLLSVCVCAVAHTQGASGVLLKGGLVMLEV